MREVPQTHSQHTNRTTELDFGDKSTCFRGDPNDTTSICSRHLFNLCLGPAQGHTFPPHFVPTPAPGRTWAPAVFPSYLPSTPAGAHLQQITKTRSNFPETFVWTNITTK